MSYVCNLIFKSHLNAVEFLKRQNMRINIKCHMFWIVFFWCGGWYCAGTKVRWKWKMCIWGGYAPIKYTSKLGVSKLHDVVSWNHVGVESSGSFVVESHYSGNKWLIPIQITEALYASLGKRDLTCRSRFQRNEREKEREWKSVCVHCMWFLIREHSK